MRFSVLSVLLLPFTQAFSQTRIELTGKPDAVIAEPFTMVTGVRELPGNRAIVTDQFERSVYLVDFNAGSRRQIGRQGDGPAEYRFPMAPMPAAANRTWILDATLRRLHVIGPDGTFGASLNPPYSAVPGGLLAARGVDNAGRIYFEGNSFNQETGGFIDSVSIIRWNPVGNVTENLGKVWSGGRVRVDRGGMIASVARSAMPFPAVDAWVPLPDGGVAIVRQEPHQVLLLDQGKLLPGSVIPHSPIPVTPAERSAFRERRSSARMTASGGGASYRAPPISDAEFPANMPAFIGTSVVVAPNGTVWVGRSHRSTDRTWAYDLFDRTGRQAGSATIPAHSVVVGFGNGVVYVARTNPDDDLVYLERHRLQ
jgi:hypothetical protein